MRRNIYAVAIREERRRCRIHLAFQKMNYNGKEVDNHVTLPDCIGDFVDF
jgi:hypothetical protein